MRQKAYYNANEVTNYLYTTGSEWQTEDTIEYKGLYHKYITGEVYTEPEWNPKKSKKLEPVSDKKNPIYKKLKSDIQTKYNTPKNLIPIASSTDYSNGYIIRYFLKKKNESIFIEIDKPQYDDWVSKKIDNNLYSAATIQWTIAGNIEDEKKGIIVSMGVQSKNLAQIQLAEQQLPGIGAVLSNPLQYYTDTDFKTPADINA
jgi:hypothetical protein